MFSEDKEEIHNLLSLFILQNIIKKICFIYNLSIESLLCNYFDIIDDISTEEYSLLLSNSIKYLITEICSIITLMLS